MVTQAELQQLGSAQAVFDYARNNGLSLDQLAQIGGVSSNEMANLARANGIDAKQLSTIGYVAPPPTAPSYTAPDPTLSKQPVVGTAQPAYAGTSHIMDRPPAPGTPAISGQTGIMDVTTGQFKYFGTPEYAAWEKSITPELNSMGITVQEYLGGGVGARLMSNPLTDAYSTAFAEHNADGGGTAWAQSVGGRLGFGKANGYVDANGFSTGKGEVTGVTPWFRSNALAQGADFKSFVNPQVQQPNPHATATPGGSVQPPPIAPVAPVGTATTGTVQTPVPLVAQNNSTGTSSGPKRRSLGNWSGFVNPQQANTTTSVEM